MQRLKNKVAIVTGAASGIGRATAERFADEGASVFCVDLQPGALEETVAALKAKGAKAEAFVCDASNEAQVKAAVAKCVSAFGQIDVLVNMAGILRFGHTDQMALETFELVMKVNVTSTFLFCREALPELVKTKGNIINAASTAALQGLPYGAAYGASKAACLSMTRSIAVDYAKRGVRANCVAPGDVNTAIANNITFPEDGDFSMMPRISSLSGAKGPEVVASVIAMLASDDGIHITGECIRVDGGTLA
jgi:meso-butanediol dehydrogenase / (S,S)-butanediol dehydrogenase / diacetyl reductase